MKLLDSLLEKEDDSITSDNLEQDENNMVSTILIVASWIVFFLAFVGGLILGQNSDGFNYISAIICWFSGGICSLLFFAIAEIIQILHDIRKKLYKKK